VNPSGLLTTTNSSLLELMNRNTPTVQPLPENPAPVRPISSPGLISRSNSGRCTATRRPEAHCNW
jgi:hypothetical protein